MADIAGYSLSPVQLLNRLPFGGALAGGVQEGVKSKLEGDDWTTARNKAIEGGAAGLVGSGVARTLTSPAVLGKLVELGGTAEPAGLTHAIFGPVASILGGGMANRWVQPVVKRVETGAEPSLIQRAMRNIIQGSSSSIQQTPGNPWSQWVTGQ
jgi:hypothetical protein